MFIIESFEWDDHNEMHIARHQVSPEEVEEVFLENFYHRKTAERKYLGLGRTYDGRYLFVVFALKRKWHIRVITARDMDDKELKFYKNWLRS